MSVFHFRFGNIVDEKTEDRDERKNYRKDRRKNKRANEIVNEKTNEGTVKMTNLSTLKQVCNHDNGRDMLLPNKSPKVI